MRTLIFLVTLFHASFNIAQTSIGGVINTYLNPFGYNVCTNTADVPTTDGISPGDYVLVVQMNGVEIDQSNTSDYGNILNYGSAGLYEIAQVESITPTSITFVNALLNAYDFSGIVQFVICPNYTNVNVTSQLTAQPWDGNTGGVLFLHANTVSLSANINVSNLGFRGGLVSANYYSASNCSSLDYSTTLQLGAFKGEGVFITSNSTNFGRGKNANGGGGGNNLNAGGAGGGNGGAGGKGGNQWSGCGFSTNGGIGGTNLNFTNRIFLGGGGGGGHQNNSESTPGGAGGGIIVLKSTTLNTNGFSILSNGQSVTTVAGIDAAGGAGAGGSVHIQSTLVSGNLTVEVNGGDGGSANNGFTGGGTGGQCHGTGGGGGGGAIILSLGNTPTVSSSFIGGTGGINTNPQSNCFNQNFGSENGLPGFVTQNQTIPESSTPSVGSGFTISASVVNNFCDISNQLGSIAVSVSPVGQYAYTWSHNGSLNSPNATNLSSGVYTLSVASGDCVEDTSFTVGFTEGVQQVDFTIIHPSCFESGSITINQINGGLAPYQTSLNNSPFTSSMSYFDLIPGTYLLKILDANNCEIDTLFSIEDNSNFITFSISTSTNCETEQTDLTVTATSNLSSDFTYNLGNNVNSTGNYFDLMPGVYNLTISDNQGCTLDTMVQIYPYSAMDSLVFSFENEYCGNANGSFVLQASHGDFLNPVFEFNGNTVFVGELVSELSAGIYDLTATDINGCIYDTSVFISSVQPDPFLISYTADLPGCDKYGFIQFDEPTGGFFPYEFSFNNSNFSTNSTYTYLEGGLLAVSIVDQVGCVFEYSIPLVGTSEFETLFIPNCFTPDGNEFNNVWYVQGNCIDEFKCIILNRWGQILFEFEDIDSYWDGTFGGKLCPDGVYFYKVNLKYKSGKMDELHGHITLIR